MSQCPVTMNFLSASRIGLQTLFETGTKDHLALYPHIHHTWDTGSVQN